MDIENYIKNYIANEYYVNRTTLNTVKDYQNNVRDNYLCKPIFIKKVIIINQKIITYREENSNPKCVKFTITKKSIDFV